MAEAIVARHRGSAEPPPYQGVGSCYLEFGQGTVGRVDVDFLGGTAPTAVLHAPSAELTADKAPFGTSRHARRFGE